MKPAQLVSLLCLVLAAVPALSPAQGLADLATVRPGYSQRASSHDRSGGNADALGPIAPGASHVLLETTGPGVIRHLWFTASSFARHDTVLRDLVLRITWDGAPVPSVDVPFGDFFALGHGRSYPLESLPIAVGKNSRALNCYWPMPFHKSARIELINNGVRSVRSLYFHIDYELTPVPADQGFFHALYQPRRELSTQSHEGNTTGTDNYVLLETEGEGQYVGCALFVDAVPGGWWGEGDEMIYIDGAPTPTIIGTGSEDYFGNAWGYSEAFSYPFYGAPLLEKVPGGGLQTTVYRWHVPDPVRFSKSIRVTIEHLFGTGIQNDYSSVAFWYQKDPIRQRKPLPTGLANHPRPHDDGSTVTRLRMSGTELEPELRRRGVPLQVVRLSGGVATGGGTLELIPAGGTVEVPIPVPVDGTYDVQLEFLKLEDAGVPKAGLSVDELIEADPVEKRPNRLRVTVGAARSRNGVVTLHLGGSGRISLDVIELKSVGPDPGLR